MALFTSAAQFGAHIVSIGDRVPAATEAGVRAGTRAGVKVVAHHGARVALHSRGRRVPLGAKAFVGGSGADTVGSVDGTPAGFWTIADKGSRRHLIVAKGATVGPQLGTGRGRARRSTSRAVDARLLRTPYGPRRFVRHPGHRQIVDLWAPAVADAIGDVRDAQRTAAGRVMFP